MGTIHTTNLRTAVILVGGVGYQVQLSLSEIARLGDVGEQVSLYIHTHVREDALELFGFLTEEGKTLFGHLISVSGIGPRTALALLSGMETKALTQAVAGGDFKALTHIPGIGQKMAQRVVLELKDKLSQSMGGVLPAAHLSSTLLQDLRSAISNLGYKTPHVDKAVKSVEGLAKTGQPLEHLVKEALRQLGT